MRLADLKQSSMLRPILAVAVLGAAVAAYVLWPTHQPAQRGRIGSADGRPVPVTVAQVTRRDVPIYLDALGTVQAYNTVTIRSRVDGELVEVLFKEGQDVKAGDVLAQIDPRTYRAQYEQAVATRDKDVAQLDAAKRDLARYVGLGDRVTGQSVDTQRALVRQLEATVRCVDQQRPDVAQLYRHRLAHRGAHRHAVG